MYLTSRYKSTIARHSYRIFLMGEALCKKCAGCEMCSSGSPTVLYRMFHYKGSVSCPPPPLLFFRAQTMTDSVSHSFFPSSLPSHHGSVENKPQTVHTQHTSTETGLQEYKNMYM